MMMMDFPVCVPLNYSVGCRCVELRVPLFVMCVKISQYVSNLSRFGGGLATKLHAIVERLMSSFS